MKVACIGSGYVGSVTGTAFAILGHTTTVIDVDERKIAMINSGKSPIFEPGLDDLISLSIGKSLFATDSYKPVFDADVVFIGVGTPSMSDGTADLTFIKLAASSIGKNLNPNKFTVIVNKSTVPVGTADVVGSIIEEVSGLQMEKHFAVVSNPEFLREGFALQDVFFPDRVVIGTENKRARAVMSGLYHNLLERVDYEEVALNFTFSFNPASPKAVYFETDVKSAEMIKYASNAFLAVKISYINEVARLSEALGANVLHVAKGMGLDSRIGEKFLQVSSGWSGSCFPKDTAEFLAASQKSGSELSIVKAAMESNHDMHMFVVEKVRRRLQTLRGKTVAVLGLTFKPNTDDARKTQATVIIKELIEAGAKVNVHDPQGMKMFKVLNSDLTVGYCDNAETAVIDADAVILLTHWKEYLTLDWGGILRLMNTPFILDTRNFLDQQLLNSIGFTCEGLGIGSKKTTHEQFVLDKAIPAAIV